jgi:hypothetical protein
VIHFALSGEVDPDVVRITASDTSDQRNHSQMVGTGSAVSHIVEELVRDWLVKRKVRK